MPCENCKTEFNQINSELGRYRGIVQKIANNDGLMAAMESYEKGGGKPQAQDGVDDNPLLPIVNQLKDRLEALEGGTDYKLELRDLKGQFPWMTKQDIDALEKYVEDYGIHRSLSDTFRFGFADRIAKAGTAPGGKPGASMQQVERHQEDGSASGGDIAPTTRDYSKLPKGGPTYAAMDDAFAEFNQRVETGE